MLRLGGLTPFTTIDYPDHLAAVAFCQGCPWRCGYCHNPELLPASRDETLDWSELRNLLKRRRGLLDAVVFSGGEPTLQRDLPQAMAEAWELGYKVGLHTAGCYPARLRRLLPWLDWVGLDIKAPREDYPEVTGVPGSGEAAWASLALLLEAGVPLEVRTTVDPRLLPLARLDRLIDELAEAGVRRLVLQPRRPVPGDEPPSRPAPPPYALADLRGRYRGRLEDMALRH